MPINDFQTPASESAATSGSAIKQAIGHLTQLAENFEMLRTGRHVNASHGEPYYEIKNNLEEYRDFFAAIGYELISGSVTGEDISFFYFDANKSSDDRRTTSRNIIIVYAALSEYLQRAFTTQGVGVDKSLIEIRSGKAPFEAGIIRRLTETHDMAQKLAAYGLDQPDIERIFNEMVRLGFLRKDGDHSYYILPPASRIEAACAQFQARLEAAATPEQDN